MMAMAVRLAEQHAHGEDNYVMARILIIDDNAPMRHMLRQALEWAGYEVVEAADGRAGVQLQHAMPADVIISDILMPEQEGLATIQELRHAFPTTKIIAISGGGHIGNCNFLTIAARLGAQRALQKPFGLQEMFNAVQEMLQPQD